MLRWQADESPGASATEAAHKGSQGVMALEVYNGLFESGL